MRTWDDFKTTIRTEDSKFTLARTGDLETIRTFESSIGDLEEKDGKGYSILMLAAYNGHRELTRYLLQLGANPNSQDHSGNTILMVAAFKGHRDIVEMLIESGADLFARSPKNLTADQFADMFGRSDVATFLRQRQKTALFVKPL